MIKKDNYQDINERVMIGDKDDNLISIRVEDKYCERLNTIVSKQNVGNSLGEDIVGSEYISLNFNSNNNKFNTIMCKLGS